MLELAVFLVAGVRAYRSNTNCDRRRSATSTAATDATHRLSVCVSLLLAPRHLHTSHRLEREDNDDDDDEH